MAPGLRSFIRVAIVVVLSAIAIGFTAPDILAPWSPWGSFGFDAAPDGRITTIYPGMAAAGAGLRVGDRVDVQHASRDVRRVTSPYSIRSPGVALVFPIARSGDRDEAVALTSTPFPRTAIDNVSDILSNLSAIAFILIAAALVLTRPSLLTWSFLVYAMGTPILNGVLQGALPYDYWYWTQSADSIFGLAGALAFSTFALLFPRETLSGWRRSAFATLAGLASATIALEIAMTIIAYVRPDAVLGLTAANNTYQEAYNIGMYLCGVVFFGLNYFTATPSERPRIRWVILGFIVGFFGSLVNPVMQNLPMISASPPIWLNNVLMCLNLLAPIAVLYAITKHRVIDVRFFLSRALVYGLLTGAAVVFLVLLEVLVARQLEQYHLALVVEILGALVIGLGIQRAHTVVDNLVDRFVFRSIHAAEQHLEAIGEAMIYARSVGAIDAMLRTESMRALDLESVAIVHEPDREDQLAMRLQASRHPIDTADVLAIPFLVRHQLYGYALFSHHRNGAAIDPNERDILRHLCHRAAIAYDHVTSEQRAAEITRLHGELSILRARYEEVRALIPRADQPA